MIRCTAWAKAINGNIVFLAKIPKFLLMPIKMDFNLFKEHFQEKNILSKHT
jgi:hypothetical protein